MNTLALALLMSLGNVLDDEINHSQFGFGLWRLVPQAVVAQGVSSNVYYEYTLGC